MSLATPAPRSSRLPGAMPSRLMSVLSLLLLSSFPAHVHGSFSCHDFQGGTWDTSPTLTEPTRAGITSPLTFDPPASHATIKLAKALDDYLCVLFAKFKSDDDDKEFYVPVSRSYSETTRVTGEWERVAGRYAKIDTVEEGAVEYGECHDEATVPYCELTLPFTDEDEYYVTVYKHSLAPDETMIRFLERATFGGTMGDLAGDRSDWSPEDWVSFSPPATSHREYFRKRTNPRSVEMYKHGRTGPHPCSKHSRWRAFAFTREDKVMSTGPIRRDWPMDMHKASLEQVGDYKVWKFGGRFRTEVPNGPYWSDGNSVVDDIPLGEYEVCGVDEAPGLLFDNEPSKALYARFQLKNPVNGGACTNVFGGNPRVIYSPGLKTALDSTATTASPMLSFSDLGADADEDFRYIGYDPSSAADNGFGVLLLTKSVFEQPNGICSELPDPDKADFRSTGWEYSPYYEGFEHPDWNPASRSVPDKTVFAEIGGSHYIHDRRFAPLQNTIASPLVDGGGKQTIDSVFIDVNTANPYDPEVTVNANLTIVDVDENPRTKSKISGNEQAIYCSNSAPNIFNEGECKLTDNVDACVREGADAEDTVVVTMFNAASSRYNRLSNTIGSLAAMAEHLRDMAVGIPLEVVGLTYSDGQGYPLPCLPNAVSRFKKIETESTSPVLNAATKFFFEEQLGIRKPTANDSIRDVVMSKYSACDADDMNKRGFIIEVTAGWGAGFWQNVHPSESNVYLIKDSAISSLGGNGILDWSGSSLTMAQWNQKDGSNFQYWGRKGDIRRITELMDALGIYEKAGGKSVTAAPTGRPSSSPSSSPSASISPSSSLGPSMIVSNSPSISLAPSEGPTGSREPSLSRQPSLVPTSSGIPSASVVPSSKPSIGPSASLLPSSSFGPTMVISDPPSGSAAPSIGPSASRKPSSSHQPSLSPTSSLVPTLSDSPTGSAMPSGSGDSVTGNPSVSGSPSSLPSDEPSLLPSNSNRPSVSLMPSWEPSLEPSQLSQIARTTNDNIFYNIVNDNRIAAVILETELTGKTGGVLVCGSSGEIASDPTIDDYFDYWNWRLDSTPSYSEQKKTVWTKIALESSDQLCQRTAFSLSQIFAISPSFLAYNSLSEAHTNYYDGFVRNCRSTYKKVFKTIAFSAKMGQQLSHAGSSSLRYGYDRGQGVRFPDENYARESMQLETVGLDMLNMDGTLIRDDLGRSIPTYDTFDILTFARVWTGFRLAARRGNYEENDPIKNNWNDPMLLDDIDRHDWFPKKDLLDGWIGDHHALCRDDTVDKPFLKTGATFRLLGRSSAPRYQHDPSGWIGNDQIKILRLANSGSALQDKLSCIPVDNACTYPAVVKLTEDLACNGMECEVETVRVLQVGSIFYEYVRRPCVHHAFFDDAKTVFAGSGHRMCAHPSSLVATKTCCSGGTKTNSKIECIYHGELVNFAQNTEHCGNGNTCPSDTERIVDQDACRNHVNHSQQSPKSNHFHWTSGSCEIKMKVRLDGLVALVHVPEANNRVVRYVQNTVGNLNYFHVPWPKDDFLGDELFPNMDNECGEDTCILQDDWTCLCDVVVEDTLGFTQNPSTANEIRDTLKIGAFPPSYFGNCNENDPKYDCGTDIGNRVRVYHLSNQGYTQDSIFQLPDEFDEFAEFGDEFVVDNESVIFLKNLISTIRIGDYSATEPYFSSSGRKPLIMRNPILFHDLTKPEIRDSHYEVDALIHHLTSHPTAPPFISNMLIQHFGISNPSPGYIERVAMAYKSGSYSGPTQKFGDGSFSSLVATVAAILLDPESLATSLDADPAYGGIKEPIIKVLQFMRAMEYSSTHHDRNFYPKLVNMGAKVGQMAYESPDQFSFFLSDYSPPGQFGVSELFAPPAQVLTLSTTISTIEGFFSLARQGLSSYGGGFGPSVYGGVSANARDTSRSVGYLAKSWPDVSDEDLVKNIAMLLTAGRLSSHAVSYIANAINGLDADIKPIFVQQLIATTPEFHTTNLAERTGNARPPTPKLERSPEPYKAIVVLLLSGGLDSFNVLAPHTSCALYGSYRKNRGVLALNDDEMEQITNDDPDVSECTSFGVNNNIPILRTIYNEGHGQFHANIGHLSKPVTKGNWYTETQTHLFSHKTMEREAQLVDAFQEDNWSTGVCGRMLDVLQRRGLSVEAVGIDGKGPLIEGNPSLGRTVNVIPSTNVNTLTRLSLADNDNQNDLSSIIDHLQYLNGETELESGVFANYWAQNLVDVLNRTDELSDWLNTVTLTNNAQFSGSSVGRKLRMVAKMMSLNSASHRSVNRDVFLIHNGGHDGHALSKENLQNRLPDINVGISAFYQAMIDLDLLNNLTFVMMSEFGRTITPNTGLGSDHAWGGNAFVFGGEIAGKKILGKYPESFDNSDEYQIGRGILLPYRSWESLWYGVSNWFGITNDEEMEYVLPNNGNMGCDLYTDATLYNVGNSTVKGCNDRSIEMKLSMLLEKPRYLSGLEQKKICKAALYLMTTKANVTSRCVVTDQKVVVFFEETRRELSASDLNPRFLEEDSVANITVECTIGFAYDNPGNESTAGSEYIENTDQLTQDFGALVSNGGDCTAGSGRRRLDENCGQFQNSNVESVSSFEADVTEAPSQVPSESSKPSSAPSTPPSAIPSQYPTSSMVPSSLPSMSHVPSDQPSIPPTPSPSLKPSVSESPSTSFPSSKPSVAPSSRPSRDCPNVLDECFNGGMWSHFTCECLCVSPHCPNADTGRCTETDCPADYHENLFEDQPAPWFEHGSSCVASKDLQPSVNAIYGSKKDCCVNEYQDNSGGCIARPAEVSQLSFNGKLQLEGMSCPDSGRESASAVSILASSLLSTICDLVLEPCSDGDKVVVNNFCGQDYLSEASFSSGRRYLQSADTDDVNNVVFEFISQNLDPDELELIESQLSGYLQGASLATFLAAVLSNISTSNPPPSLQSLTSLSYFTVNAFISGLGLYYPAWGNLETCLSNGKQESYMNRDHSSWLYLSLSSCCQRYFGWDLAGCIERNAEATLISGTISNTVDPTDLLFYPDWEGTDTCIDDGSAPPYMKNEASRWMYESLTDCCKSYYNWEEGFASCMSLQGGDPPTRAPITESWYINWDNFVCVESCEGGSPCGGVHDDWDVLHESKFQCCKVHLWWKEDCMQS